MPILDDVGDFLAWLLQGTGADVVSELAHGLQHGIDVRMTSLPPTRTGRFDLFLSAVCRTARSSVMLMISPRNIASRFLDLRRLGERFEASITRSFTAHLE